MFRTEIQAFCSKERQKDVFAFIKNVKYKDDFTDSQHLRKCSIYWLEDSKGGSGKSEFITWLKAGKKDLVCRLLTIDSVDRLINGVIKITKHEKVEVCIIDDTRTQGKKTSVNTMFKAIERIKNDHVVSTMYGRYAEIIYDDSQIIFCTNQDILKYVKNLSRDR